ncbi:hypothetical protein GQ56_0126855 [Burkholderia paludis]|uniref:GGDEF domain-containing protein n=1 Tax=Burkholderia paludis TaxID=1506587 RepID=UPI001376EE9E|nr:sensor domain-containing diguanylate cyclase [Burkholderia paludis]KFG94357.1 hypothetical protein GQ56_0126855 [Burkholderia paludis]
MSLISGSDRPATRTQTFLPTGRPDHLAPSVTEWLLHDDQIMRECFRHATEILKYVMGDVLAVVTVLDADHQHGGGEGGLLLRRASQASLPCDQVVCMDDVFVIEDTRAWDDLQGCAQVDLPSHVRFYAGVPIRLPDGETIGELCAMASSPRRIGARERGVLRHLGEMIENDLRLRMASAVDPLTQLFNRRSMLDYVHERWHQAHPGEGMVAVIIDIDWFKQYNDTYGHLAGDACLKAVGGVLLDAADQSNTLVGRVGGEEFAQLLMSVPRDEVEGALDRVRRMIEQLDIEHCGSPLGKVTLSIGAAYISRKSPEDRGYREAFEAADQALYRAKELGRNRVQVA